ncbi:protein MAINTENANCE OF MERISTEMS-like [Papaver somniferum]|uniref:protein MAINTENANCE OF MERISTEMS-like n=1 Tax=Papaver somniferum TaxID=3469 RepID=UPI000E6FC3AB|nr:protein MAINTENANCE OF MERISTEMS-like [Papaver somniferum]
MTITPDDVVQILRLSVDGKDVRDEFTKLLEWPKLYSLTKKCLGWDEETSTTEFKRCMKYRTRQFNMGTLIDMFKGTKEKEEKGTLTDEKVNHAATAYLLRVLGCVIFPNTSGNRVDANLLQLLDPLDKVHEYSWGTACHAWLTKESRKASRLGISQVAGNVSLLQTWIYDHFHILGLAIENPTWAKGDPRGTKYVFDDNHSRTKEQQLIRLREILDELKAQDVCFYPYKEDRADGHIAGRSDLALYFGPLWHPT